MMLEAIKAAPVRTIVQDLESGARYFVTQHRNCLAVVGGWCRIPIEELASKLTSAEFWYPDGSTATM